MICSHAGRSLNNQQLENQKGGGEVSNGRSILAVSDTHAILKLMEGQLSSLGYDTYVAEGVTDAVCFLEWQNVDLVVVEKCEKLMRWIRRYRPALPVIPVSDDQGVVKGLQSEINRLLQ